MKHTRNLLLYLLLATLVTGCKLLLPKQYDDAETSFTAKQYDKAISAYLSADKESPDNIHIKQGLVKAYSHKAVALYEQAQSRPEEDIDTKIDLYKQSRTANANAKKELEKAVVLEPLDPGVKAPNARPGQLLLPPNSDEMEYTAKIKLYQHTLTKLKARTAEALMEEEQNQADVVKGLKEAVALMKTKPEGPVKAYEAYKPFDKYAQYMKKAAKAKAAIEKTAINFYEGRGLFYVSKDAFALASKDFKAAQAIIRNSHQASAGLLAVTAKQQINKNQFEDAYASLGEIQRTHPSSKFYKKHIGTIRTKVVDRGLARAEQLTLTASIEDKAKAFDIYHGLLPIAQPVAPLTSKVNVAISKLQDQVARNLTERAIVLNTKNSFAYSSNITALLTSAHGFSDKAALPFKRMAYRANQISKEKQALPVFFTTGGQAANRNPNFRDWMNEEIFSSIPRLGIDNVAAADAYDLPNQGKGISRRDAFNGEVVPFEHSEVLFYLDVKKYQFEERGRDRPKRKSSKYVSKRYMVHNPEWDRAKDKKERAEEAYEDAKYAAEELYNACKREASRAAAALGPFGNIAASVGCRMGTNALTDAVTGRDDARAEFRNTPRQIEKKEISRYRYEEYTVSVKGELIADLYAYDRRNKKTIKLEPVKLSVEKSGQILKNVEREDVNGLKNGEKNVPNLDNEIQQKEQSAFKHARTQMAMFLESHNWKRFCYQGEALEKQKLDHASADAYSQCIALAPRTASGSKEIASANQAIQKYMGFTPDMIAKYGANKSYQNFANNSYTLSDDELNAAKKAATFAFVSRPTIDLPAFDLNAEVAALKNGEPENLIAAPIGSSPSTQTVSLEIPAQ
ncbi:tetratricopeptide repeat protein [Litoribrevibacter albus]|uniref:Tetratricopeptide repeat protein n=1 Tax=Litoribrevibacter albus TaxID=1473156 RepID=A0AA37S9X0_9GAMM|nr:hypothetical protein [Litoribrevibacter albus]GLQ30752.1 hypothetical protein GCM10007876_12310 [Litoribrevibacter albus]